MKQHMNIIYVAVGLAMIFLLRSGIAYSADERPFDLDVPLQEAIRAEQAQDYAKAVENYRKVLFVDGTNTRAEYGLARSLEKNGQKKKAVREYMILIELAKDDDVLLQTERDQYIQEANAALERLGKTNKGLASLTFLQVNILIVTIALLMTFLVKIIRYFVRDPLEVSGEEKKLINMWKDRSTLESKEREIRLFPFDILSIIMFILLVYFGWLSYSILFCK